VQRQNASTLESALALGGTSWKGGRIASVLLIVLLTALYWPIFPRLVSDWWEDPNYSHGFLVPCFSGFLIWQQREALKKLPLDGSWLGLPVLLAGIGALILGDIGAEDFLSRSSLIIILSGLILFHCGTKVFHLLLFPLGFLFFMIPLPSILFNAIAFPLQALASQNAEWGLDLLGVPVLRDGNVIHLSNITLGVTEACSGIRSLVSLLALAAGWAYTTLPGGWARLLLVVSAIPITIIANAGRVVVTGLIGQTFGERYAQGFFHSFSGWIIFLVAFVGLLGVHTLLQRFSTNKVTVEES
jgi:exosortase